MYPKDEFMLPLVAIDPHLVSVLNMNHNASVFVFVLKYSKIYSVSVSSNWMEELFSCGNECQLTLRLWLELKSKKRDTISDGHLLARSITCRIMNHRVLLRDRIARTMTFTPFNDMFIFSTSVYFYFISPAPLRNANIHKRACSHFQCNLIRL